MAIQTADQTGVHISAGLPATNDAAGYTALTFTAIGELESVGNTGVTNAAVSFTNMTTGKTSTAKGSEEAVTIDMMFGSDRSDAGQTLLLAAQASKSAYSFKVVEASGHSTYFTALVLGSSIVRGGTNDIRKFETKLGVTTHSTGDTFTEVA